MRNGGCGSTKAVVLLACLLLGGPLASPAPARSDAARASGTRGPRLPGPVRALLAQQQAGSANMMLAQLSPPRHKGYQWIVSAFKEGPSARTNLSITFLKTAAEGTQTQESTFGWTLPKGALKMDSNLKPASVTTRDGMGVNGRISMKLGGASQFVRAHDPSGCTGSISYRVGSFRGTFRFNAKDRHFGVIRFARTRVFLYRAHDLRCGGDGTAPPPCPENLWLSAVDEEAGIAVAAFRTDEGKVDQSVLAVGTSGDARTSHRIAVTVAVPDAFQASDDLTSASVDGDVAGPWLSGDLSYLAPPPATPGTDEDCGGYESTSGVVTGDYTAHFDSIGPVTPASAGTPATLRREST